MASPFRETEGMRDGSDAIADWPILNAMLNAVGGASWVSVHHGGGVGIGMSIHAGMVVVVGATDAQAVAHALTQSGESVHTIGRVVQRNQGACVQLTN